LAPRSFGLCLSLGFVLLAAGGCPRKPSSPIEGGDAPINGDAEAGADAGTRDPRVEELWDRAGDGETDDLARLADREGTDGLVERASRPAERMTALRALGYTGDLAALPFLAEVAAKGSDGEAGAALSSAAQIAAEPRRATDPEDALELHEGCAALLAVARDVARPKPRRVGAIRALRMLAERGCVKREEIPTDLDVR
jgi:hypothetical protein